ncbi:zinc finger, CCHC-type containing protein [Tanacetum coccineum]
MGDKNPIRTLGDYSKPSHEGYRNTIELPAGNNVCEIDRAAGGKLRNKNTDESWEIIENLAFYDHEGPSPQPQALGTTFETRVRDYMATHTERMERFENHLQATRGNQRNEEEENNKMDETPDNTKMPTEMEMPVRKTEAMNGAENGAKNESIITPENDEVVEASGSQPKKGKEYKISPRGPAYEAILKKNVTKKEDIRGNFEIPCGIEDLKHMNALVDQGSNMNVMPYSTYMRLTDERPAETDIRLSLASHSYIYPLGIAKDVLVEVAEHVFLVDFVILDIKENKKRPFILGTPFLTTPKATIKFDTGTITLRSRKSKISFHRISDSSCITDRGVKNDIEPIAPIMTVNRLVLELEERLKLYLEKEMKSNQWRSNNFKNKQPAPVKVEGGVDDKEEVTSVLEVSQEMSLDWMMKEKSRKDV